MFKVKIIIISLFVVIGGLSCKKKTENNSDFSRPFTPPSEPKSVSAPIIKDTAKWQIINGVSVHHIQMNLSDSIYSFNNNMQNRDPLSFMPGIHRVPLKDKITIIDTLIRKQVQSMDNPMQLRYRPNGYKEFQSVIIPNDFLAYSTHFNCYANLSNITFLKNCYFTNTCFDKRAEFNNDKFSSEFILENVTFKNSASFEGSKFKGAKFLNINSKTTILNCEGGSFQNLTLYKDSISSLHMGSVKNQLYLEDVSLDSLHYAGHLPDTLILNNISVKNGIDFTNCDFSDTVDHSFAEKKKHYIYIHNVDVTKIKMDYTHFKLLLTDLNGKTMPVSEATLLYEGLLNKSKETGQDESYKLLDIEFKKYKDTSIFKFESRLNEWWWNFGYDKEKIFSHTLLFLCIFTIITFTFFKNLQENIYTIKKIPKAIEDRNTYTRVAKRFWYSLAYSSIIFLMLSIKVDDLQLKPKPKYIIGTFYVVSMHIVGLLCLGYIANFVLQK